MKRRISWEIAYVLTILCALAAVHWGNEAVNVIAENMPLPRKNCIVIDAGHGGEDGGATSCTGRLESTYNLEISLRLRDLMNFMGYSTKMIRTTDQSVSTEGETIAQRKVSDLKNRVRMISDINHPILISIHQNQFPDSRYSGAQVFYAGTDGSEELAQKLQELVISNLNPGSRRKAKRSSGVYILERIPCTGILVECGFLSNPEEEAKLSDPAYQRNLCCVISTALDQFLNCA